MFFPYDTVKAAKIGGVWEADFPQFNDNRVIEWFSLNGGPIGSSVDVYIDNTFIDTTPRGDKNHAEYYRQLPLARGRVLRLIWSVGTGTAPIATLCTSDGKTEVTGVSNDSVIGF